MAKEGITHIPPYEDQIGVPVVEVTELEGACAVSSSRNNSLTQPQPEVTANHLSPEAHQTVGMLEYIGFYFQTADTF